MNKSEIWKEEGIIRQIYHRDEKDIHSYKYPPCTVRYFTIDEHKTKEITKRRKKKKHHGKC